MEKLKEAWHKINPDAAIEIQQSDSSMGINNTISGICEIGMASRALKDSELAQGIKPLVIAFDGIALIVHKENPVENLGKEQIKAVYTGKITKWEELQTK